MRGSAWLVIILASGTVVLAAAVPPNHAPNHRATPRYRPTRNNQPLTSSAPSTDLSTSDIDENPKRTSSAVAKLRQILASTADRSPQATQVHEEKVEAASGLHHHPHLPLVHALPQLTLLLQLLLHLLLQVVPPQPHLLNHYHHSGAPLHPHGPHHYGSHSHQGGLLHTKPLGPFYGPGLYGVSASNNVLGKGPFPSYKYEDNAKK